jgi:hypothetical protein
MMVVHGGKRGRWW